MPGTYAHYTFGKKVLVQVDYEISKIISKNVELFFIGLHGPDIFFYYKPILYHNPTNKLGHDVHYEKANVFFEKSRNIIEDSKDQEKSLAYIFGFLCHFILDSECHPYINKIIKEEKLSHTEVESEFDKLLIYKEGKNPFDIDLTTHIHADSTLSEVISPFFNTSTSKITRALSSMKFYNSIFNTPNKLSRFIIFSGLKIVALYNKLHGIFFNLDENPKCKSICLNIESLYDNSISKAACMLEDFYLSIKNNSPFPERLNRNFE